MSDCRRIDQLLAGYADGDAISHEATLIRTALRTLGYESDIVADPATVSPGLAAEILPLQGYDPGMATAVIHHYAIGSEATQVFRGIKGRKILIYHNITPSHFFAGYSDDLVSRLDQARAELATVGRLSDAVWADSEFNAGELRALGVKNVEVLELPLDPAVLSVAPEPAVLAKLTRDMANILFVGRMVPNKKVEDLILAFAWYQRINPYSRLVLVGSPRSCPRYYLMLRMLANELNLANVCFEGFASQAGLVAYYQSADVVVCPSEHEGYCLPLVEAMHMGIPVLARRRGGMPEAMGGAGVLYEDLTPGEMAELWHRLLSDFKMVSDILTGQDRRIEKLRERKLESELKTQIDRILARG